MTFVPQTVEIITTRDKILIVLGVIIVLVCGWATIEIVIGILQLIFSPRKSAEKTKAPRRIGVGCLTLIISIVIFFLLGSLIPPRIM